MAQLDNKQNSYIIFLSWLLAFLINFTFGEHNRAGKETGHKAPK